MKIVIIGEKEEQSNRFRYILDNISNYEIHFLKTQTNLLDQIEKITGNKKNQITKDLHLLFEVNKSNLQFQQTMMSQFRKASKSYPSLILLISDEQAKEDANKIKNQINRYLNVQIYNIVDYFQKNYDYDKHIDLNGKQIALFISKEQDIKNLIFKTVKSPAILQNKWALINTPQFNINQDVEERNEMISKFQQIFKKYQNQISIMFIIVDLERDDLTRKSFSNMYSYLRKFQKRIILLLYNRLDEDFQENSKLYNYFINNIKIRNVYQLSKIQLQNQQCINEYFNKILEEQQDLEIGIDMKDTIFEIRDERESEIEKQTIEEDFQATKVKQLQQSIDQDDQQIKLYQEKIAELERSKKEKLNQIREIEIFYKEKSDEKIQKETQIYSDNSSVLKIPQKQVSQTPNQNQVIIDIKNSQTIKLEIQNLEKDKQSINSQLQDCYIKLDNIPKTYNYQTSQERQLNQQIKDLWKKIEENDSKTREYNNQLEQLEQDVKKDNQKFEQTNYVYNRQFTNYPYQISKGYYDNYGSG